MTLVYILILTHFMLGFFTRLTMLHIHYDLCNTSLIFIYWGKLNCSSGKMCHFWVLFLCSALVHTSLQTKQGEFCFHILDYFANRLYSSKPLALASCPSGSEPSLSDLQQLLLFKYILMCVSNGHKLAPKICNKDLKIPQNMRYMEKI